MSNYILSCCSTADVTAELFRKRDVHYVCFHFAVDGKEYPDDLGQSYPFHKFYQDMEAGAMTKTSQISPGEFVAYFTPFLEAGKDILHVTLSSGISGVYNSACTAKSILQDKYPDRKIYIVDSLGASSGYGLLMDRLADLRDEGKTIDDVRAYAEEHKLEVQHWFFSTDLKYYVRGGRISKTSGFLGNLLHICPLLNVDEDGKLIPREKIRTIKKVEEAIVVKMEEFAQNGHEYADKVYISCSDCMDYARAVADKVEARFPKMKGKVEIFSIGTTIGSHTGPGTVALFFWGKRRSN
jgi:DegV family protein with EDD domain